MPLEDRDSVGIDTLACQRADWPRAMSIEERAQRMDPHRAAGLADKAAPAALAMAAARERLWRELPGFGPEGAFERRLGLIGIEGRDHLLNILAVNPAELVGGEVPHWAATLWAAYQRVPDPLAGKRPWVLSKLADDDPDAWPEALNAVIEPLFASRMAEHSGALRQQAAAEGAAEDIELILGARLPAMYRYLVGTFVLRMHVGERHSSGARQFADYVADILSVHGVRQLIEEYPVLGRVVVNVADLWARAETRLARRYLADRMAIAGFLGISADELKLSAVVPGLGDPHRGLQTVHAFTTVNGGKFLYKPTDCRMFEGAAAFLRWVRGHDPALGFRVPRVLTRDGYGWVEYVRREECKTEEEIADFYTRIGSMVAISWILGSSDLHSENLIASRGEPILVDLETIVGTRAGDIRRTPSGEPLLPRMLQSSVLRTGLLPTRVPVAVDITTDMSALGARPGATMPIEAWCDAGTTSMHRERIDVERPFPASAPGLRDGELPRAEDYVSQIEAGFIQTCRLFLRQKAYLESEGSALRDLGRGLYRVLFRHTGAYGRLAQQLNHPDLLTDGVDRDRHLDYLLCGAIGNADLEAVASEERRSVDRGDIPYFSVKGDARDLLSEDVPLLHDYFEVSPIEAVRERLRQLDDDCIEQQRWYLTTSLATSGLNLHGRVPPATVCCSDLASDEPSDTELLAAIERAASDLMALRYDGGADGVVWPTVRSFRGADWQVVPAGNGLYGGNAGMALFLGLAGHTLNDQRMVSVARRSLEPVIREVLASRIRGVGAFDGAAGYLYVLTCLGETWGADYTELQHKLLRTIRNSAADDQWLDVLGGVTGAGLVIANGAKLWGDPGLALDAAQACAKRIEASRTDMPDEITGWSGAQGVPLTGFAHGAAGISLACVQLGEFLGEPSLFELSHRARNFEASHFIGPEGNWADLRPWDDLPDAETTPKSATTRTTTFWCNGAVGIGLARCLETLIRPDGDQADAIRGEIAVALATAKRNGLGGGHSLCHGDLGTMELHFAASRLPGWGREANYARRIAGMVARNILATGPVCGVPVGMKAPGLMVGLGGLGFGLLRALRQDTPNVCGLEFAGN